MIAVSNNDTNILEDIYKSYKNNKNYYYELIYKSKNKTKTVWKIIKNK